MFEDWCISSNSRPSGGPDHPSFVLLFSPKDLEVLCLPAALLHVIVPLKHVLQLAGDLLEEGDLRTEVVLHLGAEVPHPRTVEVLDLCQGGAGNDVAAVVQFALLLRTVFHFGQCTCGDKDGTV